MKALILAAAMAGAIAPAVAQAQGAIPVERLEQIVAADADSGQFSGAVLVAADGVVLLDEGYGAANREWNVPNDGDTRFRLASVTKQFTAAAALLLVDDGTLALDAPISTYLADAPESWAKVTVRHCLNHTSGIPDFTRLPDYGPTKRTPTTLDGVIARVSGMPLQFAPGEGWDYSNGGYAVLTRLIEKASGLTYAEFLQQRIFAPLGMTASGYDSYEAVIPRRATGYVQTPDGIRHADFTDMSIPQGAGGLYSTTRDLLRWQQALYSGKVLKPATLAEMIRPVRNNYAMGLIVERLPQGTRIWHNGGIDGFNTFLAWDPDRKIVVAVLGNLNSMAPDRIGTKLLAVAQGQAVVLPSERQAVAVPEKTLAAYVGSYALMPGFDIAITLDGGTLRAQGSGQPVIALLPQSATLFHAPDIDAEIAFVTDAAGKVESLVLRQMGQERVAPRK